MTTRPVWAEISRQRLHDNYRLLRRLAGAADLLAIVKANAYGHGILPCAQTVCNEDSRMWLGVTGVQEGVALRATSPRARILVMGGVWKHEAEAAIAHRLTTVVWEPSHIDWLQRATGKRRPTAASVPAVSVPIHLEIDTGMSRQGVRLDVLPALLQRLKASPVLRVEGVMTHLHSPEFLDGRATTEQLDQFRTALDLIAAHGHQPLWIHAGNSATVLTEGGAKALIDFAAQYSANAMLRPGLALYGYAPRFSSAGLSLAGFSASGFSGAAPLSGVHLLQPVLSWKTRIVSLRTVAPGETAGYCATFRATRPSRLALLPAGYADGLNRHLSNRGSVLVRGQRAPIAGRISMDLTIIDVTDIPGVEIGDEVVLIGEQGREKITAYDHADWADTIPYEILCNIAARVPRVMKD
jgi:alanine racemase